MLSEYKDPLSLTAFLLSMNTMLMLEKKGLLTHDEAKEIVEQALLNLETQEQKTPLDSQEVSKAARAVLEQFRSLLAQPSSER